MNEPMVADGFEARCQKVLQVARELHARKPDWVTFFRETLGVSGAARSVFPEQKDYTVFEQSAEFTEIQNLVASLRTKKPASGKNEATRVITVRLPESLHESLKAEAADHNTSMNKLCISKLLLALIDEEEQRQAALQSPQNEAGQPATRPSVPQPPQASQQPSAALDRSQSAAPSPYQQSPQRSESPSQNPSGFRSTFGQ